jgi:BolA family transcriptional regulator, general stress-responsive regulator
MINGQYLMTDLGPIGTRLHDKLVAAFAPTLLNVIDESNQHHGHAGSHPSGESHFRVQIMADGLKGQSRVAQHRAINTVLAEELKSRVHALAIEVKA